MAAAWIMPVSVNPPLVAVAISPKRYTHRLIKESQCFIVNIPTIKMLDSVKYFGSASGYDENKIVKSKVKFREARKVKGIILEDAAGWLECKLYSQYDVGDHTIFVGEVVEAYVNMKYWSSTENTWNIKEFKPILHIGGKGYTTLSGEYLD